MPKTMIYDGDCSLCEWISDCFGRLHLAEAGHCCSFQSFDGEAARRLETAGIRNEMLVLEDATGELRAGICGFLWLLEDTHAGLAWLLGLAPLRALLQLGYRTVAYNRRLLAPPPRGFACSCDPDPHSGLRALLVSLLVAFDLGVAALLAVGVESAFGSPASPVGLLSTLLSWAGLLLIVKVLAGPDTSTVFVHTMTALAAASLWALPILLLSLVLPVAAARWLVLAALLLGTWRLAGSLVRRLA